LKWHCTAAAFKASAGHLCFTSRQGFALPLTKIEAVAEALRGLESTAWRCAPAVNENI
jgi:hypothetical protein